MSEMDETQEWLMSTTLPGGEDIDFEQDAEEARAKTADVLLPQLTKAAELYNACQAQVDKLEERVSLIKAKQKELQEKTIPELMRSMRLETFTLSDGTKLEIEDFLQVSLAGDKKGNAIAWLKKVDKTALLSSEISLTFKKGEEEKAKAALSALREAGFSAEIVEDVNTGTFKALLRELIDDGRAEEIPDNIGMYRADRAKFSVDKKKAKKS